MAGEEIRVFRPRSLGGLLRLYSRNPETLLYAGGTEIALQAARGRDRLLALPSKVCSLANVQELARIARSPRHLDIGAAVTLNRVLGIGRRALPPVLSAALASLATPSVRNLATLGGNICAGLKAAPQPSSHGAAALAALSVIGAHLEMRSLGAARWSPVFPPPAFKPGEILCRIRLPLEDWNVQVFRQASGLSFAAAARITRDTLENARFCFACPGSALVRSRELEARMKHARLPLSERVREESERAVSALLPCRGYAGAAALRLWGWFVELLNERSLTH